MQCGGGCRGQSALAFSHTLAWRYERPLAHVCTPLVSFSVCSLPAALLAVIHHGCLSREAFLQLDIILLSSAQSSSFAHGFVSQVTAIFVGNGSFRAAVLYRYISWWSPCGSVASYVTRSFLMDSILTVVREWQGVGRTEAGRGGERMRGGGDKTNGKSNWQQEKRMRCNTKKEWKGKDKRKKYDRDKPFKSSPIWNWEPWETVHNQLPPLHSRHNISLQHECSRRWHLAVLSALFLHRFDWMILLQVVNLLWKMPQTLH